MIFLKIIPFSDLHKTKFALTSLSAIKQTPKYRIMSIKNRSLNGFLLIEEGFGKYEWEGGSCDIKPQTLIYLPKGSVHKLTIESENITFYRISFTITDMVDMEEIIFCPLPWLVTNNADSIFFQNTKSLVKSCVEFGGVFKAKSILYEMLSELTMNFSTTMQSRIIPAIEYLHAHYTEEISAKTLGELCYMSETHMYRLFKKVTGKTPVEYKNGLRIKEACTLLRDGNTISEISDILGFESVFYFSRMFKKYKGVSPSVYASRHK